MRIQTLPCKTSSRQSSPLPSLQPRIGWKGERPCACLFTFPCPVVYPRYLDGHYCTDEICCVFGKSVGYKRTALDRGQALPTLTSPISPSPPSWGLPSGISAKRLDEILDTDPYTFVFRE